MTAPSPKKGTLPFYFRDRQDRLDILGEFGGHASAKGGQVPEAGI